MGWGVVDKDGILVGVPFQQYEDAEAFAAHLNKAVHDTVDLFAALMRASLGDLKSGDDTRVDWTVVDTTLNRLIDTASEVLASLRPPVPQVH